MLSLAFYLPLLWQLPFCLCHNASYLHPGNGPSPGSFMDLFSLSLPFLPSLLLLLLSSPLAALAVPRDHWCLLKMSPKLYLRPTHFWILAVQRPCLIQFCIFRTWYSIILMRLISICWADEWLIAWVTFIHNLPHIPPLYCPWISHSACIFLNSSS